MGLPSKLKALVWLASSLYKTGASRRGLPRVRQARAAAKDRALLRFLTGLEVRIRRALSVGANS
jgi:hypothetical protein